MPKFKEHSIAVVLGASGGIGHAMIRQLLDTHNFSRIFALSRSPIQSFASHPSVHWLQLNDYDEKSIEQAARDISSETDEINFALAATGFLHDDETRPEKSLGGLSKKSLEKLFNANAVTPMLFAKYFSRQMSKSNPAVLAAISARVGSTGDNRLGGWYSYRASKSALNMLYRTLSIEMKRVNPNLIICLLHPGTTDTELSKPFQKNVPAKKLFTARMSAEYLYNVITRLDKNDSGLFFDWGGKQIQW